MIIFIFSVLNMLVKMMSLPAPHVNNLAQEMRKGRERLEMANSGAAGLGTSYLCFIFRGTN